MLNHEEISNIKSIETIAKKIWGKNVEFGEIKILNSPYPEFEWTMRLYDKINILLAYDRSALDIGIPKNGQYVLMSEFTDEPFVRGMAATQPQNLLNNFQILDRVVNRLIQL